jgi:hypothetical protein
MTLHSHCRGPEFKRFLFFFEKEKETNHSNCGWKAFEATLQNQGREKETIDLDFVEVEKRYHEPENLSGPIII